MWLVYIVLLIAFIFILDKLLVDPRLLELAEKFNGPKRYPIIGTAYSYFGLKPDGEIKCVDGLSQSAQLNVKCAKIALIGE